MCFFNLKHGTWPNVVSMLGQRRRYWANIETTLGQVLVFVGELSPQQLYSHSADHAVHKLPLNEVAHAIIQ